MLLPLLMFASQSVDRADMLNEALTVCLFATSRSAAAQGQSLDQFRGTLSRSCIAEESAVRGALIPILVGRGQSSAAAERDIDQTLREARGYVLQAYSYQLPR